MPAVIVDVAARVGSVDRGDLTPRMLLGVLDGLVHGWELAATGSPLQRHSWSEEPAPVNGDARAPGATPGGVCYDRERCLIAFDAMERLVLDGGDVDGVFGPGDPERLAEAHLRRLDGEPEAKLEALLADARRWLWQ